MELQKRIQSCYIDQDMQKQIYNIKGTHEKFQKVWIVWKNLFE